MFRLIVKEITHRKINFLLAVLAVVIAVALVVSFFTAAKASNRETARLMLKLGFNLRVIPRDTDMNQFFLNGFSDRTMPQDYLNKLAQGEGFSYNHLLATLQKKITWRQQEFILTGLHPEVCPPGHKKPPMADAVAKGFVYLGHEIARKGPLKKGDTIELNGRSLTVARCLAESGSIDDIRLQCHLEDAQTILNLPGQINEIRAVDCLCFTPTKDPLAILRREINAVLPNVKVIQMKDLAQARTDTRVMVKKVFAAILPLIVLVCGIWIAVLALTNIRHRKHEIGILRALGYDSGNIALLVLGKALIIGLCGAALGFLLGTALAFRVGPDIFKITAARIITTEYGLLFLVLLAAPAFTALASFIPAMIAVSQDPALTLKEE